MVRFPIESGMKSMASILVACAILAAGSDSDAALLDLAQLPHDEKPYAVYLTLSTVEPAQRERLEKVLRFVVPSLSSKTYLAGQLPYRVPGTNLLRLNLRELGWSQETYRNVMVAHYVGKYRQDLKGLKTAPLVVRGDWFAANMLDPIESGTGQYELIYNGTIPKTADEFLKFWGIQNDAEYVFGLIEPASGVKTLADARLIESRPGSKRNRGWLTRDSRVVAGDTDPLQNLPNKAKFDAQEIIVEMPKWYAGKSGSLQAYFLADGKGARQESAPASIVVDHTNLRGVEIRNTCSCVACHVEGIRSPTVDVDGQPLDAFRTYVASGARVSFLDKNQQLATDRYHQSDVQKEILAGQQAYSAGVQLCNGWSAAENAAAYIEVVKAFDKPLGLKQAALECYTTAEELKFALASYGRSYTLTARLSELAEGRLISRDQFEADFYLANKALALWQKR